MNADDPKFTAYVLDELEPAERAAVEAELRAHPTLAAELEELRSFTGQLRGELQAEDGAPLLPEQRAVVLGQAPRLVAGPRAWWRRPWLQSAAAACVIVGLIAAHFLRQEVKTPQVAFAPSQERTVKLRLEPEVQLPQLQADHFLEAGKIVAEAKPATAPQIANSQLNFGLNSNPLATSGRAPLNLNGGALSSTSDRLAAADPRGPQTASGEFLLGYTESSKNESAAPAREPSVQGQSAEAGSVDGAVRFYDAGRYDLAIKRADQVLQKDPYNIPARKLQEKIHQEQDRKAGLSYSETRARNLWKYDQAWSSPNQLSASASSLAKDSGSDRGRAKTRSEFQNGAGGRLSDDYTREKSLGERSERGADGLALITEPDPQGNTEAYDVITDNAFCATKDQPLSTFAVDVDTASYANVRRILNANERPPKGAVRIEELVNYFHYDYPQPDGADAFSCKTEVATCPWQTEHRLACVGIKGRELKRENRPVANLVFLIDVSGSMQPENKLPLVKQSLGLLIDQLGAEDAVAIAVYAGASGCVLEPTHDREKMRGALDRLQAGGSTNGAAGIQLAYDLVQRSFKKGGTNRVILCTDGDFNVGITSQSELVSMIQGKAKTGIFLSVFGFGMGNLKDSTLEKLADKGNGNYGYIDTLAEGRKVFVEQMTGTLFTIAKDVKVQVEFNPSQVAAYRLIGYENRLLAKEDFNDDKKDAGEIGAGHTVTALYEVVPAGKEVPDAPVVDDLKYQKETKLGAVLSEVAPASKELLTVKVRYKQPDADVSKKLEFPLTDSGATWEKSSKDFRWAASVASFGLLLRDSPHKGTANWNMTLELATEGKGDDRDGYRSEFVGLVEKARALSR